MMAERTRYWASMREQDGSWMDWREVGRDYYERVSRRSDFQVTTTSEPVPDACDLPPNDKLRGGL